MAFYGSLSPQFLTRLGVVCVLISGAMGVLAVVFGVGKEWVFSFALIASFLAAGMVSIFFAYRAARFRSRLIGEVKHAKRATGLDLSAAESADLEAKWNEPAYWQEYYDQLLRDNEVARRDRLVHRDVDRLIRMLGQIGELPAKESRRVLEAGCGVTMAPNIFAYWGFSVTAVDLCPLSIEFSTRLEPSEEEMARCVSIWERVEGSRSEIRHVQDLPRSIEKLRALQALGGSVSYMVGDWLTLGLSPQSFEIVRCCNSLRFSTREYWRQSIVRFHELLVPGGVLLLENLNVFDRRDEMEPLLKEFGFTSIDFDFFHNGEPTSRDRNAKYSISIWPTG